ncbi:MAG: hypothetical protein L6Q95_19035, partial [Planctomycetes bacterium]|nr:hypothetical protein [Planctomycetota bacterium]
LRAGDGRAVLWVSAGSDRDDLASAWLYRARGEAELRRGARLAAVLAAVAGLLALAAFRGAAVPVLVRFGAAAAGAALLLVAAPEQADLFLPLVSMLAVRSQAPIR